MQRQLQAHAAIGNRDASLRGNGFEDDFAVDHSVRLGFAMPSAIKMGIAPRGQIASGVVAGDFIAGVGAVMSSGGGNSAASPFAVRLAPSPMS
jgi:hypothetical protein